jgi:hypothetical protein
LLVLHCHWNFLESICVSHLDELETISDIHVSSHLSYHLYFHFSCLVGHQGTRNSFWFLRRWRQED